MRVRSITEMRKNQFNYTLGVAGIAVARHQTFAVFLGILVG
jgi:hypothetical protein